jgi:hypothetical protein
MKNASRIPAKISCGSIRAITCICSSAITTVAIVKRTAKNRNADDSSSAFFTTTNVTPQISEQNISDKSAFFRTSIRIPVPALPRQCIRNRAHPYAIAIAHPSRTALDSPQRSGRVSS